MGNPYVYIIFSKSGEYYYGVRWKYINSPENDLWKIYFTSSKLVKEIIEKNGKDYFKANVLKLFNNKSDALDYEYQLIKKSIGDSKCLNRAIGKCTIWNDELRKKVSISVKKFYQSAENKKIRSDRMKGNKNINFMLPSWRNINSDVSGWLKSQIIYNDYVNENWNLNKYGFGRLFLMKRYDIKQGTARNLILKLKNGWNPNIDKDFIKFYNENCKILISNYN